MTETPKLTVLRIVTVTLMNGMLQPCVEFCLACPGNSTLAESSLAPEQLLIRESLPTFPR
jgi:hypothetical protein